MCMQASSRKEKVTGISVIFFLVSEKKLDESVTMKVYGNIKNTPKLSLLPLLIWSADVNGSPSNVKFARMLHCILHNDENRTEVFANF